MSTVLAGDGLGAARSLRDLGAPTQPELAPLPKDFRPLTRGARGPQVRELQRRLVALRIPGALAAQASGPGVFGPLTKAAVIAFQERHGLKPTGQVGPYTHAAIERELTRLQPVEPPAAQPASSTKRAPTTDYVGRFLGTRPAEGTDLVDPSAPVPPSVTSHASNRSAARYADAINQFAVGVNPRYARRGTQTFGPLFVWDVTCAMGAEVPPRSPQGLKDWLATSGASRGWKLADGRTAQLYANEGRPALATGGSGSGAQVAVVRPGNFTEGGPTVAFAGNRNFNHGHALHAFGAAVKPEYFVHA